MDCQSLLRVEGFQGEGVGRNEPRQFLALFLAFTSGYRRPLVLDTAMQNEKSMTGSRLRHDLTKKVKNKNKNRHHRKD